MSKISYIDLFSGCGGLSYGFSKNKKFECLLATDHWHKAETNYKINHPDTPFEVHDFYNEVEVESIVNRFAGKCEIVLGGPPCQGFSTLGKRTLECEKSILVDTFLNAAVRIKPKFILMENVKAITSKKHPNGGLFTDHIDSILTKHGYFYKAVVLKALDYGLGQTRERFFLFATEKCNQDKLDIFVEELSKRKKNQHTTLKDLIGDLPSIEAGEGADLTHHENKIIYNHRAMKHSEKLIKRFQSVPDDGGLLDVPKELLTNHLLKMVNGQYGTGGHAKNIYGRMNWNKPSGTIVAGMDKITIGRFLHPINHRLLTPRECARIQSFPDDFVFEGSLVTQYYLIGNAVPPIFSKAFTTAYLKSFGKQ